MTEFAKKLVVLMAKRRLSYKQLAALVGAAEVTVQEWCGGRYAPRPVFRHLIAKTLQVPLADLWPELDDMTELARKLMTIMAKSGVSNLKLAKLTGVTENAVCDWCKGRCTPLPANRQQIADALQIPLTELWPERSDMVFANRLLSVMGKRGFRSREALAARLAEVSGNTVKSMLQMISLWLNGRHLPAKTSRVRLCHALSVSYAELFAGIPLPKTGRALPPPPNPDLCPWCEERPCRVTLFQKVTHRNRHTFWKVENFCSDYCRRASRRFNLHNHDPLWPTLEQAQRLLAAAGIKTFDQYMADKPEGMPWHPHKVYGSFRLLVPDGDTQPIPEHHYVILAMANHGIFHRIIGDRIGISQVRVSQIVRVMQQIEAAGFTSLRIPSLANRKTPPKQTMRARKEVVA